MSKVYKVLMADDEEDILAIMAKGITAEGYEVVTARDGEEAWQKIVSENPDVIVLDLTMPKKDGFGVLKELREHPPSAKWQPVIVVTARKELEAMQQSFNLEADHYIAKPCRIEDILKAIRLMISLIPQHISKSDNSS